MVQFEPTGEIASSVFANIASYSFDISVSLYCFIHHHISFCACLAIFVVLRCFVHINFSGSSKHSKATAVLHHFVHTLRNMYLLHYVCNMDIWVDIAVVLSVSLPAQPKSGFDLELS